jgi:hypothetical protein
MAMSLLVCMALVLHLSLPAAASAHARSSSWFPSFSYDHHDDDDAQDDSITSRVFRLPERIYQYFARGLGYMVPMFAYTAKDDEHNPGFAYKRGREVQDLDEKGALIDFRNSHGRKRGMLAPRPDRFAGESGQREKNMMLAEERSAEGPNIVDLISKTNDLLRMTEQGGGEYNIELEDLVAKVKKRVHEKIKLRHQDAKDLPDGGKQSGKEEQTTSSEESETSTSS